VKRFGAGLVGAASNITSSKEEKDKKKEEKKAQKGHRPEDELGMKETQNKLQRRFCRPISVLSASARARQKYGRFVRLEALYQFEIHKEIVLNLPALPKSKVGKGADDFYYRRFDDGYDCPLP